MDRGGRNGGSRQRALERNGAGGDVLGPAGSGAARTGDADPDAVCRSDATACR